MSWPFSPDTTLVVGAILVLLLVGNWRSIANYLKPPTTIYERPTWASLLVGGEIVDPHDTVEQKGFSHIQGAIHALKQSPRCSPDDLEALASLAAKLIDLVEPDAEKKA